MQIVVIDYGAGNLGSVANALNCLGYEYKLTSQPKHVLEAHAVIFPGVGAAADCMQRLLRTKIADAVSRRIEQQKPVFAICVGLQVLFTGTEEGGWCDCLDIIRGKVKRLPPGLKIPHMGWNQVRQRHEHALWRDIPGDSRFYFVHSYYAVPANEGDVAATTPYGVEFASVISRDNVFAAQFHPEKSQHVGLQLLSNFVGWNGES